MVREGERIGRFRVLDKLGEGGMGLVFRAQDEDLERPVALKFPSVVQLEAPEARQRFLREARAAARLQHPGICTIHEIGEHEGQPYIAMELVDGETVAQRLTRAQGAMPVAEALAITRGIAEALAEAHRQGVLHRDLKGGNVILRPDGTPCITDFGLAKLMPAGGPDSATREAFAELTVPGTAMGTLGYVSPEQARGEAVGPRSDLFSLGVMLYEMLTGVSPFHRGSVPATLDALFREDPPAPSRSGSQVPGALDAVVARLLAKQPGERYASAEELLAALDAFESLEKAPSEKQGSRPRWPLLLAATAVGAALVAAGLLLIPGALRGKDAGPPRSMAVLPFANLSANPEDDAFVDGLTEEIGAKLARLNDLRVSSRAASFRFRGREAEPSEIGRQLGVEALLAGGVRRHGGRLRVTAELIQTSDGFQLWSDEFDRSWSLDDLIGVQEALAREIASALDIRLSPAEEERLARRATANPEAYELYLRSLSMFGGGSRQEHMASIEGLRQAVRLDPEFAEAHAALAIACSVLVDWGMDSDPAWLELARQAADRAIELEPEEPTAYSALLVLSYQEWNVEETRRLTRKLLTLDKDDPLGHFHLGYGYMRLGFLEEGERELQAALRNDPFFLPARMNLHMIDDSRGDFQAGVAGMRVLLAEHPEHQLLTSFLAYSLTKVGRSQEAVSLLEPLRDAHPLVPIILAMAYTRLGRVAEARELESPEVIDFAESSSWAMHYLGQLYALQGRDEEALGVIERAGDRGSSFLFLEVEPAFDGLREQAEFKRLVADKKSRACAFARGDSNLADAYRRLGCATIR